MPDPTATPSRAPVWGSTAPPPPRRATPGSGAPVPDYRPSTSAPTIAGVVVVSLVVLLALLAGVVAWQATDTERGDVAAEDEAEATPPDDPNGGLAPQAPTGTPVPLPTPPPSTTPPAPAVDPALLDEIAEVQEFVSRQRSLDYLADVTVEVVDEPTYDARVLASLEARREIIEDDGRVWSAVGLVDPSVPFFDSVWTVEITTTSVRYDPATNVLVVADGEIDPYRRTELVRELTVALVDQHFEVSRPELDALPDESAFAFRALVEGDAARVVDLYNQSSTADDAEEVATRETEVITEVLSFGIPEQILTYTEGPARVGSILVEELVFSRGGLLDRAYASPPVTSEQLISADVYEAGEGPIEVPPPPADGEVFDEGIFGEFLLIIALSEILDESQAFDVGDGWGGDWFVGWLTPDGAPCIRVDLTGDDPGETDEMEVGLLQWAEESGAEVERPSSDIVRFTRCAASGGGAASRA